ncbi:MAG: hypothetical protein ACREON_18635, partial [Gemmatimonadaceae bacterium]
SMTWREPRVSLVAVAALILRRRRTMLVVPLLFVAGTLAYSLIRGREYVARATFLAESGESKTAGLAGLAAQFGFDIPGISKGASLDFFAGVLESRELLREAVLTNYRFRTGETGADSMEGNLVELLRARGRTPEARLRNAIKRLDRRLDVAADPKAGVVRMAVRTHWPELSVQVNRRLLDLLNEFNVSRRSSRARAEREFVENRLAEAKRELERSERVLEGFLARNRSYRDSPQLLFDQNRLQRQVTFNQTVYGQVAQAFEEARVDEVRDTPVITVIDRPEGFAERAWSLALRALVALLVGIAAAVSLVLLRESLARQRLTNPDDFARFDEARRAALPGMRSRGHIGQGTAAASPTPDAR